MGGKSSKPDTADQIPHSSGKYTFDIAITGVSGAGKSSLVNALRDMLTDDEAGAAVVDVIQGTMEPVGYLYPKYPDVTIWDLPGIGTPEFEADGYLRDMDFDKYDFFIIVGERSFTEYDIMLACEIQRMNKRFFYVRTKVDVSIDADRMNPNFSEDQTLQQIRSYCCENLKNAGDSSPRVFLISRWDLNMYDFPLLQRTLQNELEDLKRRTLIQFQDLEMKIRNRPNEALRRFFLGGAISKAKLQSDLERLIAALEGKDLPDIVAQCCRDFELLESTTLDIAVTGQSGAGKSSLVNALRGMSDYEEGSAETGVTQTTMKPKSYHHPIFPKVKLWDLPGIGTREFAAREYLETVNFRKYDFFIIVSGERFTEHDIILAHEIQRMGKRFYYVRTKVDVSINSERRKKNFNEEETIGTIKRYCCKYLRMAGDSSPRVFLISRRDLNKYDFPLLHKTLENDLDDLKRHTLILATPIFSGEIVKKKRAALEALIWKLATMSCFGGVVPVHGLSFACDIDILVRALISFCKVFGLDEDSLCILAKQVGKPVQELKSAIKNTPMTSEIDTEMVIDFLSKSSVCSSLMLLEQIYDFIPLLGSIFGVTSSFLTTFYMLRTFLHNVEVDAANVRTKATQR
ncbi:interferon-inducible GTPase 5-like [Rhineura floridana]|uniref:interferon-inducible GTPase 5-like n=1 Tax=Rhineura floridana TaxID=261503 RepID=UPI002AC83DD2|nr:interferon-inducible GTPase 5-like [Rhineura floridana]XP_061452680.1 interferon-inducible GTPase 5-like [Rhineura floridana]XP_061452681.1 interferon-inducible GTPase 5-like [Rhineura floridana]XP_061452682.1 interferon-inducible GTPase 5-like [Rhineura floridana]